MLDNQLSTLQIRLLLKCGVKPLSKSQLSDFALYRKANPGERKTEIEKLIAQGLLVAKEMPKEGANKIPTFYFLTDKGKKWIEQYKTDYPT